MSVTLFLILSFVQYCNYLFCIQLPPALLQVPPLLLFTNTTLAVVYKCHTCFVYKYHACFCILVPPLLLFTSATLAFVYKYHPCFCLHVSPMHLFTSTMLAFVYKWHPCFLFTIATLSFVYKCHTCFCFKSLCTHSIVNISIWTCLILSIHTFISSFAIPSVVTKQFNVLTSEVDARHIHLFGGVSMHEHLDCSTLI